MKTIRDFIHILETDYSKASAEDHRVFAAYRKKHKIDMLGLDDEELNRHWEKALTNRQLYPIPITEPEYLYHGTAKARLPNIILRGLVPSEKSRWSKSGLTYHSLGRVFFANTIEKAEFYARSASRNNFVILRVARNTLVDMKEDPKEEDGAYYVEHAIPPEQIDVWNGKRWVPLKMTLKP